MMMRNDAVANGKREAASKKYDIYDRAFRFAARTAKFLQAVPKSLTITEYQKQLIRSSGSIGANLEEADGTLSRKDFVNRVAIARREARESRHWLRLIQETAVIQDEKTKAELTALVQESMEILLILSSIIRKTQEKDL